ncbi:MAG: hypothetical protein ACTSO7_18045, partial [Candidatus Heimdallarchaeota archaeon]
MVKKKISLAKHDVPDYDVKYKDKYLYHELVNDPMSYNTISLIRELSHEEKFLLLLDRGMESQHIALLYNLKPNVKKMLNKKYSHLAENGEFLFLDREKPFKDEQQYADLMNAGMAMIKEKAFDKAQLFFEQVLIRDPAFYFAVLGLGMLFDRKGQ